MNKFFVILFISLSCFFETFAQNMTSQKYVQQYKDLAIREMKRMGVPAAITLAQGLLETESGNSELLMKSNNHFGIKCKNTWTAESISHDDDAQGECFRVYKNAEESYRDHSNFLRGDDRYAFLFKLDPTDYKGWAYGLRKAGYATNPDYPEILINNIEVNNLQQYTLQAAGDVPKFDASKYTDDTETKSSDEDQNNSLSNSGANSVQPAKLTINGSRALFVSKGTSLLAVATENNISLSKLLEINELSKDGLLDKDQFIFLEKKQKEGNRNFYFTEPNETLYDVAQKNGILLQSIYDYNNLSSNDNVRAGTKIFLKPGSSNQKPQIHEVQPQEGLYSISKKYGVSVEQIREWNNLQDDHLQIGQQLIISK